MNRWWALGILLAAIAGATVGSLLANPYPQPAQTYSARERSGDDYYAKKQVEWLEKIHAAIVSANQQKAAETLPRTLHQAMTQFRCASCHTEGQLRGVKKDGKPNDTVLVEKTGKVAPFSTAEKRLIMRVVRDGFMPDGGPQLTPEQLQRFEDLLYQKEIIP